MVDKVTRDRGENVQDTRGQLVTGPFENQARALPGGEMNTPITPPMMDVQAKTPLPSALPTFNTVPTPQPMDYGGLQQSIENIARQYQTGQAKAQVQKDKSVGFTLEFQHLDEVHAWRETGLDKYGQKISASELSRRQLQESLDAGVSAEMVHATSSGSQSLINQQENADLTKMKGEAAKLKSDIDGATVSAEIYTFTTARKNRVDAYGNVDPIATEGQINEQVAKFDDPNLKARVQEALYNHAFQEFQGTTRHLDRAGAIGNYTQLVEDYKAQGLDEYSAKGKAYEDVLQAGGDTEGIDAYLKNSDGVAMDYRRYQDQQKVNAMQTAGALGATLDGLTPENPTLFLQQLTAPGTGLVQDPANTSVIEGLLQKNGSLKAIQTLDAVRKIKTDYQTLNKLGNLIESEKLAVSKVAASKPLVGKTLQDLKTSGVISPDAFNDSGALLPGVLINGQPTDKGRLLLTAKGRPTPLGKATVGELVKNPETGAYEETKGWVDFFNPDGSFTQEGALHYANRQGIVDPQLLQVLKGEASQVFPDGSTAKVRDAEIAERTDRLNKAKAEYLRIQQSYTQPNGKAIDGFPTLDERLSNKGMYRKNVAPLLSSTNGTRAGQSQVLRATNQLLGMDTSAGPEDGNLACAWWVSKVLKLANIPGFVPTNSTVNIQQQLAGGLGIRTNWDGAQAGDIIVVPAQGGQHGHVGIFTDNGQTIASNASSTAVAKVNFTKETWQAHYSKPGQQTYIYKINGDMLAEREYQNKLVTTRSIGEGAKTIGALIPVITQKAKAKGIPPSVVVAQAILESGHGTSEVARKQSNYFGVTNAGEGTGFRNYPHPLASASEQITRLTSGRYKELVGITEPLKFAQGLQRLGYAGSDSNYAKKLMSVISQYGLAALDKGIGAAKKVVMGYVPEVR